MKLTVFGSTGGTGQEVVKQALAQGHELTVLVRNPEKLKQKNENLHVVQGDIMDFSLVERSIKRQDGVLCNLGALPTDKSCLRAKGTENIIRAMEKTGVRRFVCQSALGVGDSRALLPFHYRYLLVPLLLRHVYADHAIQEKLIKKSQLDWVIVRPGVLTDGELTGSYNQDVSTDDSTAKFKISRADVADFMIKQLTEDAWLHRAPTISY